MVAPPAFGPVRNHIGNTCATTIHDHSVNTRVLKVTCRQRHIRHKQAAHANVHRDIALRLIKEDDAD